VASFVHAKEAEAGLNRGGEVPPFAETPGILRNYLGGLFEEIRLSPSFPADIFLCLMRRCQPQIEAPFI
jgi:hypothetical protein